MELGVWLPCLAQELKLEKTRKDGGELENCIFPEHKTGVEAIIEFPVTISHHPTYVIIALG